MKNYIKQFTQKEFSAHVAEKFFGTKPANKLVIHHTWKPTKKDWRGASTMRGIKKYYESKGWGAAPHLFIAEDGIWRMWDMRKDGIHAGRIGNDRSIGIEVVGNYDAEKWSGKTKENTLHAIRTLCAKLNIPYSRIMFHRDYSRKTCPGTAITKEWLIEELNNSKNNQVTSNNMQVSKEFQKVIKTLTGENVGNKMNENEMGRVTERLERVGARMADLRKERDDMAQLATKLEEERDKAQEELRKLDDTVLVAQTDAEKDLQSKIDELSGELVMKNKYIQRLKLELKETDEANIYLGDKLEALQKPKSDDYPSLSPDETITLITTKDWKRAGWTLANFAMAVGVSYLSYLASDQNVAIAATVLPLAQAAAQFITKKLNS